VPFFKIESEHNRFFRFVQQGGDFQLIPIASWSLTCAHSYAPTRQSSTVNSGAQVAQIEH